jgi:hypothetical protein
MAESSDNDQSQQQYQEILDQYADALNQSSSPPVVESPILTPPLPTKAPATADPLTPPVPESVILPPPPEIIPPTPSSSPSTFIKIIFYFSVLIFLAVVVAIANSFIKKQQPFSVPTPTPVPTETKPTAICELNEKTYQIGETFPSTDGCNTCACQSDQLIICTEKACEATPSAKPTLSPKVTPTKSSTANVPLPISNLFSAVNTYLKSKVIAVSENQFYSSQGMINKQSWKLDISKVNKEKGLVSEVFMKQFKMEIGPGGGDRGGASIMEFMNDQLDCYYSTGNNSTGGPETWNDSNSYSYLSCVEK